MRVFILTYGTEGDVRPYAALARGLVQAGHEAALCTSDAFAPLTEAAGVPLLGFGNDLHDAMRDTMERAGNVLDMTRSAPRLMGLMREAMTRQWELARDYAPDLVVFHPKPLSGPHLAEALGVPGVMALPLPLYHATADYPSPLLARLPRPLWPFSHWVGRSGTAPYARMINGYRRSLGLPPTGRVLRELTQPDGRPREVLYPYSPSFLPAPRDYPPSAHVTGYWFLETPEAPAPEVATFVDAGADLYLGFGSMGLGRLRDRLSEAVAGALTSTGVRAVVATGWGGLASDAMPANALAVERVPHSWLLPRVRGVVHHGGAGSVGAGLRAGRPTLVCPLLGDQPFWADRVHQAGLGPEPIPLRRLTADSLARAIDTLLTDADAARRAEQVGEAIRREDGVARAIEVLEQAR